MTQSAVSHALARLEGSLRIKLFERENQRLQSRLGYELRVNLSSLGEMIRLTNGVSLLNALSAADLCANGDLVARAFDSNQWFNFISYIAARSRTIAQLATCLKSREPACARRRRRRLTRRRFPLGRPVYAPLERKNQFCVLR
ncbi:LysR family transcriptional regulator [Paraburkholderia sp. A3BS-1L]|uniref:helix-turn-helix domain-containing protein n=1 Tax=Paraburkholderia sp. A3BS-1L TaxID=3028375 RepID=UPI003DA8AC93